MRVVVGWWAAAVLALAGIAALAVIVTPGLLAIAAGSTAGRSVPSPATEPVAATPRPAPDLAPDPVPEPEPDPEPQFDPEPDPDPESDPDPEPDPDPGPDPDPEPVLPPGSPSDEVTLVRVATIEGNLAPKSVVSTHTGLFLAQNMMYLHTISVYGRDHELVRTIPDTVVLEDYGLVGPGQPVRGSPVEAAVSPDGRYAYVSNYRMYGPGYDRPGGDTCSPADNVDESTVYRLDLDTLEIDQVIEVGAIPKFVAVSPDGRLVLVTNWCSDDLSIIDTEQAREVARLDIGRYPRGIAITPDSSVAYVAVMGGAHLVEVDLEQQTTRTIEGIGRGPRHLVLSPDGRTLYATLNAEGVVVRLDLDTGAQDRIATGNAPRSMEIAADGRTLYVVNYRSDTLSVVRTEDLELLQTLPTDDRPIGVTVDRATGEVWVASYSGRLAVFDAE